jgi:4,4'-diapophytoene synthase
VPRWQAQDTGSMSDLEYQDYILQGVSRTFALTIPQLPEALRDVVGNAYLLCRITDTIEDDPALGALQKRELAKMFSNVVAGKVAAQEFADRLCPLLSDHISEAEHDLVKNTERVIRLAHGFNAQQRAAMQRCVAIMADGMVDYQINKSPHGLKDLPDMDKYCYYVAGVVGEMLTELFCDYSGKIASHRELMMKLAVSFGQGLQMTNILKDIWEDQERGACWLPQDIFRDHGFELENLGKNHHDGGFQDGLGELIAIAHAHLRNALSYTLLIPRHEKGLRKFCFWALGMALLTLRRINSHRAYTSGQEVKISRRSVKATIIATQLTVGSDSMPRLLFNMTAAGLPHSPAFVIPSDTSATVPLN